MTFYEYLEEEAKQKGYKDLTEFCMRAGISAYLQERFKYNSVLRNDTKAKIAKALRTDRGFVNDLIAKAQGDTNVKEPIAVKVVEKPVVVKEKPVEIKEEPVIEEPVTVEEEVKEMEEVKTAVNTDIDVIQKQEKNAANLEFVYNNIDAYRDLKDTFYLRQAQVYLDKMIEDVENA